MRTITVGALRKALKDVDDNLVVVMDAFDHNYVPITCASEVEAHDQRPDSPEFGQYGGEDCEEDCGPKVTVFRIG